MTNTQKKATERIYLGRVKNFFKAANVAEILIEENELKLGDIIKIREGSKSKKIFENLTDKLKDYNSPGWVSFDLGSMEGKILDKPKNVETFLDLNAVLEFYSR